MIAGYARRYDIVRQPMQCQDMGGRRKLFPHERGVPTFELGKIGGVDGELGGLSGDRDCHCVIAFFVKGVRWEHVFVSG